MRSFRTSESLATRQKARCKSEGAVEKQRIDCIYKQSQSRTHLSLTLNSRSTPNNHETNFEITVILKTTFNSYQGSETFTLGCILKRCSSFTSCNDDLSSSGVLNHWFLFMSEVHPGLSRLVNILFVTPETPSDLCPIYCLLLSQKDNP